MYMFDKQKELVSETGNKKWLRLLTVVIYVISVSVVALILGLYYRLVWRPIYDTDTLHHDVTPSQTDMNISLGTINLQRAVDNHNIVS